MLSVYRGAGLFEACDPAELIERLERHRRPLAATFADDRVALVAHYARAIQADRRWKGSAPIQALAFWLRGAAVKRMAQDFHARRPPQVRTVARGVAFHLPPQNVDTMFFYSWALAFLCGNVNVVRLPEQRSVTIQALLDPLLALLAEGGYGDMFVQYPRERRDINAAISAISDARLVWGGDAKAKSFDEFPLRMGGKNLVFSDRYSHAVVSARAVAALDEQALDRLAKRLSDDIRLFDQKACSSPHTVHLMMDCDRPEEAIVPLLTRVDALSQGLPAIDPAHGMVKFTAACLMAATGTIARADRYSNEMSVVALAGDERRGPAVGGGFLSLRPVHAVGEIAADLTERDQTVAHYGLDAEQLEELFAVAAASGVSRVVPMGEALNFDPVWDGYDLLTELSRFVTTKAA